MAEGIEVIARAARSGRQGHRTWTRPNGMTIERVRVPLGVIGIIYESRPNVTADAGALALKAGNAVILRGGSDSHRSSRAIHAALAKGLREADLPEDAIPLVPTRDRAAVGMMLAGLDGAIDVIVPRGGKSLVARVQAEARVPVFAHLEGVCHVYVDKAADARHGEDHRAQRQDAAHRRLRRGRDPAGRSRGGRRRTSSRWSTMLLDAGCEVRGDAAVQKVDARVKPASEDDWSTEYLDAIIAARVVDGVDAAIEHIERYGSHHTDAIVTDDKADGGEIPERGRFRDRAAQRLDAIRRRRRIRLRRRDRHRHRQAACARPGRRRAAHQLQVPRARHRADQAVSVSAAMQASAPRPCRRMRRGMRIGLFGGTFDPPHAAHRGASLLALKRLKLDRVWWLVTPGNPLKDTRGLAARGAHRGRPRARHHPRIDVTGLEAVINTRYTYDTLRVSWCAAARACGSSGSWARTTCGASTAGRTGAASLRSCRSPWSTASARASTPPAAAPPRRSRATACPKRLAADARRPQPAGLGLSPRPQIAAVLDRAARPANKAGAKPLKPFRPARAYLSVSSGPGDSGA